MKEFDYKNASDDELIVHSWRVSIAVWKQLFDQLYKPTPLWFWECQ